MKKLLKAVLTGCLAVTCAFALTACSSSDSSSSRLDEIKERGYIVLGTSPDYAPNEFYIEEDGEKKIVGSDIALAQAIADYIGVELKIQESDFYTVIANVQAGNVDMGIAGFAWTEERDDVVEFSDDYSRTADGSFQGLMVRTEDADKYATKEEMKEAGIKVGAQTGSIQYSMALTIADESNIVALSDTTSCAALLSTGDIDAFVCTSTQAYALMETYDNITLLSQDEFDMDPDDYYDRTGVIVQKDSSSDELLEIINEVIAASKEENEDGQTQLDIWYYEATDLMPFEIDEGSLDDYEDAEDYDSSLGVDDDATYSE